MECMGVSSGCGEQETGVASRSGWNLWVWLLGVVVRRYIDFLMLFIPTPLVSLLFGSSIPTFCSLTLGAHARGLQYLLTLGAHARGLQYSFCLCVCLSVCLCVCVCVFPILAPRAIRRTNSSISDFSAIRA